MRRYVVLLGPPGSGKGTQAKRISESMAMPHISSGDLFRENIRNETELGLLANQYIRKGELVPDDVTIAMVRDRLQQADCAEGAILDGFPRTPAQAEALDEIASDLEGSVTEVVLVEVPEEKLVERLSGRWMSKSGRVYHTLYNPPKTHGVDDLDGSPLYQREDDQPQTVRNRIAVYRADTAPLISHYDKKDLLKEVDGDHGIEAVAQAILETLGVNSSP
jgi:adenylate kinase